MTPINSWHECKYYIKADLYRYMTSISFFSFCRSYFTPGFRYTFWLRITQWSKQSKFFLIFLIARVFLRRYSIRYGIMIPYQTTIGAGLYIGHFSCIVVSPQTILGKNVNLSQGVTLGQKKGNSPTIGDAVYIGAGAKVIGNVVIGNRVAVGANSVVTKDIPENSVVVGVPAVIISTKGSYDSVGSFLD